MDAFIVDHSISSTVVAAIVDERPVSGVSVAISVLTTLRRLFAFWDIDERYGAYDS
jgi:hypothetical protein